MTATADDPESLVLSEGGSCSLLRGKLASKRLANHVINLRGTMQEGTATEPQTIVVNGVDTVGAACQQTCTLEPPGHRGVHKKEKAGTLGGTPGQ